MRARRSWPSCRTLLRGSSRSAARKAASAAAQYASPPEASSSSARLATASQAARAARRGEWAARSSSEARPGAGACARGWRRTFAAMAASSSCSDRPTSAAPRAAGGLRRRARRSSAWTSGSGIPAACHERASRASAGESKSPRPRSRDSSAAISSMYSRGVTSSVPSYPWGLTLRGKRRLPARSGMRSSRTRKPASTLRNIPLLHHRLSTVGRPSGARKRGAFLRGPQPLGNSAIGAVEESRAGISEREDEHEHRSLVRSAPAGMPEDLRERALPARTAGALGLAGAPFLLEHDDLVVQRDVALRPAEHLDRGGQL